MREKKFLTPQQKKEFILKMIAKGDPRSYNEIATDLELEIWTFKMQGDYQKSFTQHAER